MAPSSSCYLSHHTSLGHTITDILKPLWVLLCDVTSTRSVTASHVTTNALWTVWKTDKLICVGKGCCHRMWIPVELPREGSILVLCPFLSHICYFFILRAKIHTTAVYNDTLDYVYLKVNWKQVWLDVVSLYPAVLIQPWSWVWLNTFIDNYNYTIISK